MQTIRHHCIPMYFHGFFFCRSELFNQVIFITSQAHAMQPCNWSYSYLGKIVSVMSSFHFGELVVCYLVLCVNLHSSQLQTNSFQGILITDGSTSYAVFTYRCGYMGWSDEPTLIGFRTGSYYTTNSFSGNSANDIACANSPESVWTNVFYTLGNSSMYLVHYCVS